MAMQIRRRLEGTGPFAPLALAALVIGSVFLLLAATGPSAVQWTGRQVHASEQGGVIYFSYQGQHYTMDDPGSKRTGTRTVYLDPADPAAAITASPVDRALDVVTVGGPCLAAAAFVAAGVRRQRRYRWRRLEFDRATRR